MSLETSAFWVQSGRFVCYWCRIRVQATVIATNDVIMLLINTHAAVVIVGGRWAAAGPLIWDRSVTWRLQLRFDFDSTDVRLRSLRSQWRNTSAPADPLATVTLTCLFISVAVRQPGRNVGRRMVAARSNCRCNQRVRCRSACGLAASATCNRWRDAMSPAGRHYRQRPSRHDWRTILSTKSHARRPATASATDSDWHFGRSLSPPTVRLTAHWHSDRRRRNNRYQRSPGNSRILDARGLWDHQNTC